ncbi:MAG: radical SAM protein [Myxococcota bacterium]|nr:radical SAM protein [Myxococcota bacterium]
MRKEAALARLASCDLCPRACGVNRLRDEVGVCRIGRYARVASVSPHFGEESPLVGTRGSGTVFMVGCNLNCSFCQNADISHSAAGREVTARKLAQAFLSIQDLGCHNLNIVTPTHVLAQILEALVLAVENGLRMPLVWNSGGYESTDALKLLDGVVDIYMPDLKFMDESPAAAFCSAPDYPEIAQAAILEMHRQVGDLEMDENGLAIKGLLVRHLVMPEGLGGSQKAIAFLSKEVSPHTYINVMNQYRPCHLARGDHRIGCRPDPLLWTEAQGQAITAGLRVDKG